MSFFAVLLALFIEQARPLTRGNWIHVSLRVWACWTARNFDAGKRRHGWVAWSVTVILPTLMVLGVHALLWHLSGVLAFAWSVAVLYMTLGFRQFSHYFTDIRDALEDADEPLARELLAKWRQVDASELPRSEIVRHVIEYSVLAAHHHVFGVLAWFSIFAALGLGPAGAVLYRMSEFVARYWTYKSHQRGEGISASLRHVAMRFWGLIDFLPARMTALGFAVVGSFEDAVDCWRNYKQRFPVTTARHNDGVLLAATSGAVNVRLGGQALKTVEMPSTLQSFQATGPDVLTESLTQMTSGREPEVAHLRSIVGLVWRSVVLWMVVLALLTLARLLG